MLGFGNQPWYTTNWNEYSAFEGTPAIIISEGFLTSMNDTLDDNYNFDFSEEMLFHKMDFYEIICFSWSNDFQ